jgi:hypothetical protein
MKITKSRLKEIIQEETEKFRESRRAHPTVEIDPKDLEKIHTPQRNKIEQEIKQTEQIVKEITSKVGYEKFAELLLKRINTSVLHSIVKSIAAEIGIKR